MGNKKDNKVISLNIKNKHYTYSKDVMLLRLEDYTKCTTYGFDYFASFMIGNKDTFDFLIGRIESGSPILAINEYTEHHPALIIGIPKYFSIVELVRKMNEISKSFNSTFKKRLQKINNLIKSLAISDQPEDIAKMILNNGDMFENVLSCIEKENPLFSIVNYSDDFGAPFNNTPRSYSIVELVRLMSKLSNLTEEQSTRYEKLKYLVSLKSVYHSFGSSFHEAVVEGKRIAVPVKLLTEILEDQTAYDKVKESIYKSYTKEEIIYVLTDFINRHQIEVRYDLSEDIVARIKDIKNYSDIDCQAMGKILETKCPESDKTLSNQFNQANIDIIPSQYTDLEKSLYIYMLLCREYDVHSCDEMNIDCLPEKRPVTDLKFLKLFGQYLTALGINYELKQLTRKQHSNDVMPISYYLVYRVGKYLVNTDIPETLFNSDYMSVKAGCLPSGICCLNGNELTRYEFQTAMIEAKKLLDWKDNKKDYDYFSDNLLENIKNVCLLCYENNVTGLLGIIKIKQYFETKYFDEIISGMAGYVITTNDSSKMDGIIVARQEGDTIVYLYCVDKKLPVVVDSEFVKNKIKDSSSKVVGSIFDNDKKMKLE